MKPVSGTVKDSVRDDAPAAGPKIVLSSGTGAGNDAGRGDDAVGRAGARPPGAPLLAQREGRPCDRWRCTPGARVSPAGARPRAHAGRSVMRHQAGRCSSPRRVPTGTDRDGSAPRTDDRRRSSGYNGAVDRGAGPWCGSSRDQYSERDGVERRLIPGLLRHLRPRQRGRDGPGAAPGAHDRRGRPSLLPGPQRAGHGARPRSASPERSTGCRPWRAPPRSAPARRTC